MSLKGTVQRYLTGSKEVTFDMSSFNIKQLIEFWPDSLLGRLCLPSALRGGGGGEGWEGHPLCHIGKQEVGTYISSLLCTHLAPGSTSS
jgi:hypothetical protein